jgi:hypothetical protein
MLSFHTARQRARTGNKTPPRIGLAVAGGGPIGGMYELGALRALDEAVEGLDLSRLRRREQRRLPRRRPGQPHRHGRDVPHLPDRR